MSRPPAVSRWPGRKAHVAASGVAAALAVYYLVASVTGGAAQPLQRWLLAGAALAAAVLLVASLVFDTHPSAWAGIALLWLPLAVQWPLSSMGLGGALYGTGLALATVLMAFAEVQSHSPDGAAST